MVGYKSSRMRKLVEKLRPASGAASIVSNPFPPPRRSLSPRGPPSPPPPPPSLPRQDVAVLEDGSRGLFRQLANPANMCQHVRVRVRVHVCVPRDLATLSSLLRYPPSLPPSLGGPSRSCQTFSRPRKSKCARRHAVPAGGSDVNALSRLTRCGVGAVADLDAARSARQIQRELKWI